jgi:hypothetical protein
MMKNGLRMKPALPLLFISCFLLCPAQAQTTPVANKNSSPGEPPTQSAFDVLTQSNRDLLDLLKKQQKVLEDIQYDRRLQSRQIQSVEERLTDALQQNAQLQAKVAALEAKLAAGPVSGATNAPPSQPTVSQQAPPPPPPSTYLPPPDSEGAPGTQSWHRLFTLSGQDGKNSDIFHVQGRQWRVLWHNQDNPGKEYQNTSALFISAFPKDDTIPQKVCSKLGSGGDATELVGPGNYYLKIEASGGSWELAVEDFR